MPQQFSTDLSAGQSAPASSIVFSSPLADITYPSMAFDAPIGPVFPTNSIVRASAVLNSKTPAAGESGVLELHILQPNGQHATFATDPIVEGGISAKSFTFAIKAGERVRITIRPSGSGEFILQGLQFALVLESVL